MECVDKYDEMLMMLFKGGKWKQYNPFVVKGHLTAMDRHGTLIEDRKDGELLGYVGYLKVGFLGIQQLKNSIFPTHFVGNEIVPMYLASKAGIAGIRRMYREFREKTHTEWKIWSARKGKVRFLHGGEPCRR